MAEGKLVRRYRTLITRSQKLAADIEAARVAMQLACKHPVVAEYPYRPGVTLGEATPPYRVCADCGFAEEGWGCGWQILTATPSAVVAERVGPIHYNGFFVRVGNETNRRKLYERAVRGEW